MRSRLSDEAVIAANLRSLVPAGLAQGRRNELDANITFAETCLFHGQLTPIHHISPPYASTVPPHLIPNP